MNDVEMVINKMFESNDEVVIMFLSENKESINTIFSVKEKVDRGSFAELFDEDDKEKQLFIDLEDVFNVNGSFSVELGCYEIMVNICKKEEWYSQVNAMWS